MLVFMTPFLFYILHLYMLRDTQPNLLGTEPNGCNSKKHPYHMVRRCAKTHTAYDIKNNMFTRAAKSSPPDWRSAGWSPTASNSVSGTEKELGNAHATMMSPRYRG